MFLTCANYFESLFKIIAIIIIINPISIAIFFNCLRDVPTKLPEIDKVATLISLQL
jgi:hypothetical protein